MPRTPAPDKAVRATGASLIAVVLVAICFAAMVLLHVVRTDLDPVRQVMSEYANGRFGYLMTAAFYAIGLSSVVLALRLGRWLFIVRSPWSYGSCLPWAASVWC